MYVFDGKPPDFKSGELEKRRALAQTARDELAKATEAGDAELMEKFSKRTVRATKEHTGAWDQLRLESVGTVLSVGTC